jgi:hypothetical protein
MRQQCARFTEPRRGAACSPYMQTSLVPVLILLLVIGGIAMGYFARPAETPEQYAHRTCKEAPTVGVTFERCVEGRTLQRLAGRKDEDR